MGKPSSRGFLKPRPIVSKTEFPRQIKYNYGKEISISNSSSGIITKTCPINSDGETIIDINNGKGTNYLNVKHKTNSAFDSKDLVKQENKDMSVSGLSVGEKVKTCPVDELNKTVIYPEWNDSVKFDNEPIKHYPKDLPLSKSPFGRKEFPKQSPYLPNREIYFGGKTIGVKTKSCQDLSEKKVIQIIPGPWKRIYHIFGGTSSTVKWDYSISSGNSSILGWTKYIQGGDAVGYYVIYGGTSLIPGPTKILFGGVADTSRWQKGFDGGQSYLS